MNAQEKKEYALALKIGRKRFGTPCHHEIVEQGQCCQCLRKVYQPETKYPLKNDDNGIS